MDMETVIQLLDRAKSAAGTDSDNAFAQAIGVTRGAVSNWRRGVAFPDAVTCATLAKLTGEPLAKVLGIVGEARAISAAEKAVWRKLATAAALALAVLPMTYSAPAVAKAESQLAMHYAKLRARLFLRWLAAALARFKHVTAVSPGYLRNGKTTPRLLAA